MSVTPKSLGLAALGCLVVGFLLGFIPEYIAKSHVERHVVELTGQGENTESALSNTQRRLKLNEFAVQAATVAADANSNNFADASNDASALFSGLRRYVDTASDDSSKTHIQDVLSMRDSTIAGLAKADPSVRPALAEIFQTLRALGRQG